LPLFIRPPNANDLSLPPLPPPCRHRRRRHQDGDPTEKSWPERWEKKLPIII